MYLLKRSLYPSWVILFDKTQYLENRIKLPVYVPGSYIQVMKYLNCHFDILL